MLSNGLTPTIPQISHIFGNKYGDYREMPRGESLSLGEEALAPMSRRMGCLPNKATTAYSPSLLDVAIRNAGKR
jgi:hypothetical protein